MIIPTLSPSYFAGLSYPALIIAGVVAQPYASLVVGSLAAADIFNLVEVFAIFFGTDIVMDCVWYVLGHRHGARTLQFLKRITRARDEDVDRLPRLFHERPALILISAKLLGGFGMMPVILFAAGASKMPFGRYIALNAFGEIFWTGGFLAIGYYFGAYILQVSSVVEKVGLTVLGIGALVLFFWFGRRVYRQLLS